MTRVSPSARNPLDLIPFDENPRNVLGATPIWRESLTGLEWAQLRMSAVYHGVGIPRGSGEPVVLVPGFLGTDLLLTELYWWLLRIGYRPYLSRLGLVAHCPDVMARALARTTMRASGETSMPVNIVGHSLGGMLARAVASDQPEHIDRVITLSSPFGGVAGIHPLVQAATQTLRAYRGINVTRSPRPACFSGHCTCGFARQGLEPPHADFRRFAIFSKIDGVVDWRTCIEDDSSLNDEVHTSHIGLLWSASAYAAIGRRLAQDRPGRSPI